MQREAVAGALCMSVQRRNLLLAAITVAAAATLPRPSLAASPASRADGVEDQTARLQTLIDAATRQGAVAALPPGRFRCQTLSLPDGAMVAGTAGRTWLRATGPQPLFQARGLTRARLSGLGLEGSSASPAALIAATDTTNLDILDCRLQGGRSGIRLERCGGRLTQLTLAGQGDSAIFALDSRGLAIADNQVSDCGNNGIQVWRSVKGDDGTLIEGNRISAIRFDQGGTGENGNGIGLFRAGGVRVSGNVITDCALTAIRNNGGSNVSILGNYCRGFGETAIFVEFGFDGAVVAQNIVEDASSGISITNFDQGGRLAVCSGNLLRRMRKVRPPYGGEVGGGIGIHAEADCAISGNVIESAGSFGILLGWGAFMRNLSATGNMLRDCDTGIGVSLVGRERSAAISGNVIAGAKRGAILGMEWLKPVTGDLAKTPDPRAAGLAIASNVVS
jgi:uncharacterized secreted repeat protein (TIGR03808 family)